MAIYKLTKDALTLLSGTQFGAEGILERKDLQRLLRTQIQALAPDLMVICEEFGQWVDSSRRIDLLCLDRVANLVIVELKRTEDGGYMELQAVRYAAMISAMTFSQLVHAHEAYLTNTARNPEEAQKEILEFLDWDEPQEDKFAPDVRIILASANFSKELTTSVMWLNEHDVDVTCIRLRPYKDELGGIFLDVQQIIPLPEAADYQTQIKAKEQAGKAHRAERYDLRYQFWSQLLNLAKTKTELHANRNPGIYNWIGGSIGKAGLSLNYAVREDESQVELYIDLGAGNDDQTLEIFKQLKAHKSAIEATFGGDLEWQDLPEKRACRIRKIIEGGYRSPQAEWPKIHDALVDSMIRLDKSMRPFVQALKK